MHLEENLFVYGTLRRPPRNRFADLLDSIGHWLGQGTVCGRLYQVASYPGLVLSDSLDDRVRGDIYRLNQASQIWTILDEYEGCAAGDSSPHEFERRTIKVAMDDGSRIQATAYLYRFGVKGLTVIETGDFLAGVQDI